MVLFYSFTTCTLAAIGCQLEREREREREILCVSERVTRGGEWEKCMPSLA